MEPETKEGKGGQMGRDDDEMRDRIDFLTLMKDNHEERILDITANIISLSKRVKALEYWVANYNRYHQQKEEGEDAKQQSQ